MPHSCRVGVSAGSPRFITTSSGEFGSWLAALDDGACVELDCRRRVSVETADDSLPFRVGFRSIGFATNGAPSAGVERSFPREGAAFFENNCAIELEDLDGWPVGILDSILRGRD
jgi:hypothetical protein